MNAFSKSDHIVKDSVITSVKFLINNYVLIALLFCVGECVVDIDIEGTVILKEVLLSMLYDAIRTQGHEAVGIATKISEYLIGMISTHNPSVFIGLRHGSLYDPRHGSYN